MPGEFVARQGLISRGNVVVTGSLTTSGSLTATGTITATTLVVQTVTSSISSITGSTNFGSLSSNTHTFTGSLNVTGALAVVTNGIEFQVNPTGVNLGNALTDNHIISGSLRVNPNGLFVSGSGLVGINNINPSYTLSVNGDIASIGGIYYLQRSSNSVILPIIRYWNGTGSPMTGGALGDILTIGTQGTNDFTFATDNTRRMTITSTGNVGIGTTSPNYSLASRTVLDINGTSESLLSFSNGGTARGYIYNTSGGQTYWTEGSRNMEFGIAGAGYMGFGTNNTERMRITSAGNVGIANTSPRARLDVGGAIMTQYQASTIADKGAGFFCESTGAGISTGFGFVIQDGFSFQGDNAASNRKLSVRKPTADGSLGDLVAYIDSAAGNSWFAGRMERPNQPAFQANRGTSGNQSLNGSENILQFNNVVYDNSSSYNTSTFRFTAPVAGCYLFTCQARYDNTSVSNSYIRTFFSVNGASGTGASYNYGHQIMGPNGGYSTSYQSGTISAVLKLAAGDYVNVRGGVDSATTGLQFESQFSGFLI